MRGLVLCALVAMLTAGCIDESPAIAPESVDAVVDVTKVPFHSRGCQVTVVGPVVDYAETDQWLPPGFRPADASTLIDDPVQLGQGIIAVVSFVCEETTVTRGPLDMALVGILVESPAEANDMPASRFNFYEILRLAPDDEQRDVLDAFGWPVEGLASATIEVQLDAPVAEAPTTNYRPYAAKAITTLEGPSGPLFRGDTVGTQHFLVKSKPVRFWTLLPEGDVGLMQIHATENGAGGAGRCQIEPETVIAQVYGDLDCESSATLSAVFPNQSWQGHFSRVPRYDPAS